MSQLIRCTECWQWTPASPTAKGKQKVCCEECRDKRNCKLARKRRRELPLPTRCLAGRCDGDRGNPDPVGCKDSIDRKSSRIGVVQAGLARPQELAVAAWLSFIPRDR